MIDQGIELKSKNLIINGTKIIQLKACGVTVKDSMSFIAGPLAKFPKTFDLKERQKGYFPIMFDTKENRNYKGPWPDKKHYLPDNKIATERNIFMKWYEKQSQKNEVSHNVYILSINFYCLFIGVRYDRTETKIL